PCAVSGGPATGAGFAITRSAPSPAASDVRTGTCVTWAMSRASPGLARLAAVAPGLITTKTTAAVTPIAAAAAIAIAIGRRVLAGRGEKSMISGSERSGSGTAHAPGRKRAMPPWPRPKRASQLNRHRRGRGGRSDEGFGGAAGGEGRVRAARRGVGGRQRRRRALGGVGVK